MVALFAIWGVAQLMFSVLGVLALTRYRALLPFVDVGISSMSNVNGR